MRNASLFDVLEEWLQRSRVLSYFALPPLRYYGSYKTAFVHEILRSMYQSIFQLQVLRNCLFFLHYDYGDSERLWIWTWPERSVNTIVSFLISVSLDFIRAGKPFP